MGSSAPATANLSNPSHISANHVATPTRNKTSRPKTWPAFLLLDRPSRFYIVPYQHRVSYARHGVWHGDADAERVERRLQRGADQREYIRGDRNGGQLTVSIQRQHRRLHSHERRRHD